MGLGLPEVIFILVIALLIFGPKRLPEISRTLGKGMAEFRKATNDLKNTISTELTVEEAQPARPRRVDLASVAPAFGSPAARQSPAETVPYAAEAPAPAPAAAEAVEAVASAHEAAAAVPPAAPELAPPADPELADPIQPS